MRRGGLGGGGRRTRGVLLALGLLAVAGTAGGCGAVWTYDQAMRARDRIYPFHFAPPDSEAFATPQPPPVYAVVFKEDFYIPAEPPEPGKPGRPRRVVSEAQGPLIVLPDSAAAAADSLAGPKLPPQPVQVDLTPAQEQALLGTTRRDMARADSLLSRFQGTAGAAGAPREQVEAARGLLAQAEAALKRKDFQGAANLAQKARLLAETLAAGRP